MKPSFDANEAKIFAAKQRRADRIFFACGVVILIGVLAVLLVLIGSLLMEGIGRLSWSFLFSFPSRFAEKAGIISAWVGSLSVMFVTACVAIPLGIGAAIYLEEYASKNRFTSLIELNINNLAGVPSIVYGIMGLGLFVYGLNLGHSILTAGLTLGILVLPIIIVTARESLRTVPLSMREAAFALGATKWQVVKDHLLPYSMGGILTGVVISLSRAIGETAPLLTIGALSFIAFLPSAPLTPEPPFVSFQWLLDPFTVLPIQMFNWISRPQHEFHLNASAAGTILLILTLGMNAVAITIRGRYRRKIKW
jgi:phosphate transport system permease protein